MTKNPTERVDTDELPIVIESGGSTEADEYVAIEEGECGNCGYDRLRVTSKYGETYKKCMLCDSSSHHPTEWTEPSTAKERLHELRDWADNEDSPVVKHGRVKRSRFSIDAEVYGYENTDVFKLFTFGRKGVNVSQTNLTGDDLDTVLSILERDEGYVSEWVNENVHDRQVRPAVGYNPNATHIGRFTYNDKDYNPVRVHSMFDHDDDVNWPIVLHIPPDADDIAV